MFVNMQYYFAYLLSTYREIAASVCCGSLINNMSVSDETSLISSEVECMGLGYNMLFLSKTKMNFENSEFWHTWSNDNIHQVLQIAERSDQYCRDVTC